MKVLLTKSDANMEACQILIDTELFSSSIHCAYYSCYQRILHIMFNKLGYGDDYDKIDEVKNNGSHNYTINIIRKYLTDKGIDIRDFNSSIRDLKVLRKNADYKQLLILKKESMNALAKASSLNTFLTNKFDL